MTFNQEIAKLPAGVGNIEVVLYDFLVAPTDKDGNPIPSERQTARFDIQILDAAGQPIGRRYGSLAPHLLPAEIAALKNFLDILRARAVAEIIG